MSSKVTQLQGLLDDLPDALVGVDRSGTIRFASPLAESLFGYERNGLVGVLLETLLPQSGAQVQAAYKRGVELARSNEPALSKPKISGVHRDGSRFPVDIALSTLDASTLDASTLDAGDELLAVVSVRDMTRYLEADTKHRRARGRPDERARSDEERAFEAAQSMIEASLDCLVVISPDGRITDANAATVKLTGSSREELIGTSFSDYFTDPRKAEEVYQLVLRKEGAVTDYPLTLRHQNGHETRTEVRYNASVYRDAGGDVRGVFASARDVTEQMDAQRAMIEQQEAAQNRLEELERFQRLTVGRELRMIELKKEIEHLKRPGEAKESNGGDQDEV